MAFKKRKAHDLDTAIRQIIGSMNELRGAASQLQQAARASGANQDGIDQNWESYFNSTDASIRAATRKVNEMTVWIMSCDL